MTLSYGRCHHETVTRSYAGANSVPQLEWGGGRGQPATGLGTGREPAKASTNNPVVPPAHGRERWWAEEQRRAV